jgi:hypothetical protein
MSKISRLNLAYAVTFGLVFVWSIPGTIALRTLLLIVGLALAAGGAEERRRFLIFLGRIPRSAPVALFILSVWFVFQAVFVSGETAWALGELRGQWLTALAALALGLLMGNLDEKSQQARGSALWTGVALVLASQALIAVGQSLWHWYAEGTMLRWVVPLTGGRLEMSYVVNILLTIITVDLFSRIGYKRPLLRLPVPATLACTGLALAANYLAGSRNGLLGTVFLALTATFLFLFDGRDRLGFKKTLLIATVLVVGLAGFSVVSYQGDPRWRVFSETARIAVDIDHQKAWFDNSSYPLPLLSSGVPVDESAYLRIAWLTAGVRIASDVPFGVGYGRNAFLRALRLHYPAKLGHSHSGYVDLLSGAGIPGVALWLCFAVALILSGWRSYVANHRPVGLLLILLVAGFNGRMLIESISRDHMLQIYFFLVGALLLACSSAPKNSVSSENQ